MKSLQVSKENCTFLIKIILLLLSQNVSTKCLLKNFPDDAFDLSVITSYYLLGSNGENESGLTYFNNNHHTQSVSAAMYISGPDICQMSSPTQVQTNRDGESILN